MVIRATVHTTSPKVSSNFWNRVFSPIQRRLRETGRFYRARQYSQYLTFPFAY